MYTIYCYFNAKEIQSILNAVVMFMGSGAANGDYLMLLKTVALLGLIVAACYGFARAKGEEAVFYLIFVAMFYGGLFVPRVTVTIEDHSGIGGAPLVVDNVPLGLAFFASTTSHIGYWLTEGFETMFADPQLKISNHGLMGGL